MPHLLTTIAFAELATGRLEQARDRLEGLVPLIEGRDIYTSSWALGLLAEARRLLADGAAESTALEAQASAERIGNRLFATRARLTLGRLAAARGSGRSPSSTPSRTSTPASRAATRPTSRPVSTPSGRSRRASARRGRGAAVRRGRARPRRDRGRPRPARGGALGRDRRRLREALGDDAYEAARAEGAELSTEDALEWARRARGPRRRPAGGWESLTPTEAKVVELVAEGLTNPQIGERMFISTATVKTHLAHIFRQARRPQPRRAERPSRRAATPAC